MYNISLMSMHTDMSFISLVISLLVSLIFIRVGCIKCIRKVWCIL